MRQEVVPHPEGEVRFLRLPQVEDEELFDLKLLLGLSSLSCSLTGGPSHLVSNQREPLDVLYPLIFIVLLMAGSVIELFYLLTQLSNLVLHVLLFKSLLDE